MSNSDLVLSHSAALVSASAADKFQVGFEDGVVSVARGADLDIDAANGVRVYRVVVAAFDRGEPQRSAETLVVVSIIDVNNKAPSFVAPLFRANVSEAAPPGSFVINATAVDADDDAELFYEILYADIEGEERKVV